MLCIYLDANIPFFSLIGSYISPRMPVGKMGAKGFFLYLSALRVRYNCSVKLVNGVVHSSGELGAWFNCLELDVTSQNVDYILGSRSLCNSLCSYYVLLKEPQ